MNDHGSPRQPGGHDGMDQIAAIHKLTPARHYNFLPA